MRMNTPDILQKILNTKRAEITQRSQRVNQQALAEQAAHHPPARGFIDALQRRLTADEPAVIAEIKKASPSKGVIREDFDPAAIARGYAAAGAACLSVLTDADYFQGSEAYLQTARSACALPVIRKDFLIDPYQIYEARAIEADCVLLIAAALSDEVLHSLYHLATHLGMDVLIEVHDLGELQRVLPLNAPLIGINNRNLRSFATSLDTTLQLLPHVPDETLLVTESGIHTADDVERMRQQNVHSFLVGETFMRANDPGAALQQFFFP